MGVYIFVILIVGCLFIAATTIALTIISARINDAYDKIQRLIDADSAMNRRIDNITILCDVDEEEEWF